MIYADNAATTKLCEQAFDAMKPYLLDQYGNASQPYVFSRASKKALRSARESIAECIGSLPEEIYFTSGGTESDNWVIKSSLFMGKRKNGVLTSSIEHHAILNSCRTVEELGIPVAYIPVDTEGVLHPSALESKISANTGIVSIMYANNEIGTIEPIHELARIAHHYGSVFHTDAVQAMGHVPINVHDEGIDLLSASAHKFNGPKGIGFLYMKKGINLHPYADGGSQEMGYRAGTENVPAIVGMAVALKKNIDQMAEKKKRLLLIEKTFLTALHEFDLDFIRNGASRHLPGNVNISFYKADGEMLLHRLDLKGICVSTGSACDSVNTQISHVLQAINTPKDYAEGTIRVTFGADNTEKDAIEIAKAIKAILK
ncbi:MULTISPECIES: cysteine desulfurase family protein [Megasphaera]|jgi:cysteine desulfurase|uniref:cysteine desulfurase family protein n=1 Tax=Megasphaera TaxID=906 RepID=UPI00210ADBBB|nr:MULTISPECIES: cysteine desulfurase family protein [Megasphaera]MCQ4113136.1 cysteine desulfurase [Megasphaera sp. SC8-1]